MCDSNVIHICATLMCDSNDYSDGWLNISPKWKRRCQNMSWTCKEMNIVTSEWIHGTEIKEDKYDPEM